MLATKPRPICAYGGTVAQAESERLAGRAALVTGADQPVGRACAVALAAGGARVVCTAAREQDLVQTLEGISAEAEGIGHDVSDGTSWDAALATCESAFSRLDILINAAQTFAAQSIADTSVAQLREVVDAAGVGTWLGQKLGVLAMRRGGGGAIVNVTSVLARVAAEAAVGNCIAARAVLMSSKAAALECARAKDNIVVNTVLAGPIYGDEGATFPGLAVLPDAPLVAAEDVAAAVLFFVTDGAGYMTGAELAVDGGYLSS